ncbi:MAG: Ig-like domain-containing protein [Pseudomonadota bacterium]|nr:Ig-like domain-containing protein [Pseudomonadota bacterium]
MDDAPRRERPNWLLALLLLLLGTAGGLVGYVYWSSPQPPVPVAAPSAPVARRVAPSPSAERPPASVAVVPPGPSFDVVRIGPQGHAVIAGRAEGGAEVTVYDGQRVLGTARADAQGQFVMLPEARLAPGGRELTLSARGADGKVVTGADSVILIVPEDQVAAAQIGAPEPSSPPVAVLLPRGGDAPRVLTGGGQNRRLGLDTVDYDDKGEIRFAGSAKPDAPVRVYVDDHLVGDTKSGAGGQWVFVPASPVAPGVHRLRVDQLGPDGRVVSRVELPFQRTATAPDGLASGRAVVQPGQNLWRIARQSYGQGTRYTVIYLANRDQIRDPNRIYPGQIFAVPPRS